MREGAEGAEAITLHGEGSLSSWYTVNAAKRRMKTGPGWSVDLGGESLDYVVWSADISKKQDRRKLIQAMQAFDATQAYRLP